MRELKSVGKCHLKKLDRWGLSDFTKCAHGINTVLTFLLCEAFQKFPL